MDDSTQNKNAVVQAARKMLRQQDSRSFNLKRMARMVAFQMDEFQDLRTEYKGFLDSVENCLSTSEKLCVKGEDVFYVSSKTVKRNPNEDGDNTQSNAPPQTKKKARVDKSILQDRSSNMASSSKKKVANIGKKTTTKNYGNDDGNKKMSTRGGMEDYMDRVMASDLSDYTVYDGCTEVRRKINAFVKRDGVTKSAFCRVLGNINTGSLHQFLKKSKQNGCGMEIYPLAYEFFEKIRILENKKKSKTRFQNEIDHPNGFSTEANCGRPSSYSYYKY